MSRRSILTGALVALYLAIGLQFGVALQKAMPAVNWKGVLYVTIAWPGMLRASPIKAPIPMWVFSFPDEPVSA